jgi:hypothetical protein
MFRRWIIRSLFIGLLMLGVGVWVGSYWRGVEVRYFGQHHQFAVAATYGSACICDVDVIENSHAYSYWGWSLESAEDSRFIRDVYRLEEYQFLGFAYQPRHAGPSMWQVFIPLWFPTLLSALFLLIVIRKTRSEISGKAFPVEPISARAS